MEFIKIIFIPIIIPALVSLLTSIIFYQYKIRFKQLHLERIRILKKLWEKINFCYEELIEYLANHDKTLLTRLAGDLLDLRTFFRNNSIYFDKDISDKFNTLFYDFQGTIAETQVNKMADTLKRMKEPLEQEFRTMLGV
jgi:hypothetical protein